MSSSSLTPDRISIRSTFSRRARLTGAAPGARTFASQRLIMVARPPAARISIREAPSAGRYIR